jgi:lipopolysaccharide transport system ATP-binding protein
MSSGDIAISVRNLSKAYVIAHNAARHTTLAEAMMHRLRRPFERPAQETFWALRDLSLDIKKGEVVGIIGRNGAGKSTFLKILSRITEPTGGKIDLYGRIGSLLEVGTGFHPELTGRENIYLNGQILGMRKREIDRQFDAIVDFAGVEQFLDTPVKRYSSGMYVRLAFAVAAHLDSEILVVDEVLAVGDAEFQKKCLGKMGDVARSGRTVLFVSHTMSAIESLCTRVVWLKSGAVAMTAEPRRVIDSYQLAISEDTASVQLAEREDRSGNGIVRLTGFRIEDSAGRPLTSVRSGQDVVFAFDYRSSSGDRLRNVDVGISLGASDHSHLFVLYSSYVGQQFGDLPPSGRVRCLIRRFPIAPGRYRVGARVVVNSDEADWPRDGVADLNVEPGDFYGSGARGFEGAAPLLVPGDWSANAAPQHAVALAAGGEAWAV